MKKTMLRIGALTSALALSALASHGVTTPGTCTTRCSLQKSVYWQSSYNGCCNATSTVCPDGNPRLGWAYANPGQSPVRCPL
jgi:hypothetical protein